MEKEGRGGPRPKPLVQFGLGLGGARATSWLLPTKAHVGPILHRGVPVTPRYSGKIPGSLRTILMSEYNLPIFEFVSLNHFETPRHVRDLIRDSKQPLVTKIHISYNAYRHRTLSVRTLRVRELCRHDRDTSPINNQ